MAQTVCNPIRTTAPLHSFPVMNDSRIDDRALMELGVLAAGLEAQIDAIPAMPPWTTISKRNG
jgi:hypothetical protein